mgnify:CR=1 FL=1
MAEEIDAPVMFQLAGDGNKNGGSVTGSVTDSATVESGESFAEDDDIDDSCRWSFKDSADGASEGDVPKEDKESTLKGYEKVEEIETVSNHTKTVEDETPDTDEHRPKSRSKPSRANSGSLRRARKKDELKAHSDHPPKSRPMKRNVSFGGVETRPPQLSKKSSMCSIRSRGSSGTLQVGRCASSGATRQSRGDKLNLHPSSSDQPPKLNWRPSPSAQELEQPNSAPGSRANLRRMLYDPNELALQLQGFQEALSMEVMRREEKSDELGTVPILSRGASLGTASILSRGASLGTVPPILSRGASLDTVPPILSRGLSSRSGSFRNVKHTSGDEKKGSGLSAQAKRDLRERLRSRTPPPRTASLGSTVSLRPRGSCGDLKESNHRSRALPSRTRSGDGLSRRHRGSCDNLKASNHGDGLSRRHRGSLDNLKASNHGDGLSRRHRGSCENLKASNHGDGLSRRNRGSCGDLKASNHSKRGGRPVPNRENSFKGTSRSRRDPRDISAMQNAAIDLVDLSPEEEEENEQDCEGCEEGCEECVSEEEVQAEDTKETKSSLFKTVSKVAMKTTKATTKVVSKAVKSTNKAVRSAAKTNSKAAKACTIGEEASAAEGDAVAHPEGTPSEEQ